MQLEDRYVEITCRPAARKTAKPTHRRDRNVGAMILFALLVVGVVAGSWLAVFP